MRASVLALAAAFLLGTAPVQGAFRVQDRFVADRWSWTHSAGGALAYPALRMAGNGPAAAAGWSLALAVAWEVGDGLKPADRPAARWHDFATTADGFSYSDIVYHMAGTYCAWLVLDAAGLPVWASVGPRGVLVAWRLR